MIKILLLLLYNFLDDKHIETANISEQWKNESSAYLLYFTEIHLLLTLQKKSLTFQFPLIRMIQISKNWICKPLRCVFTTRNFLQIGENEYCIFPNKKKRCCTIISSKVQTCFFLYWQFVAKLLNALCNEMFTFYHKC